MQAGDMGCADPAVVPPLVLLDLQRLVGEGAQLAHHVEGGLVPAQVDLVGGNALQGARPGVAPSLVPNQLQGNTVDETVRGCRLGPKQLQDDTLSETIWEAEGKPGGWSALWQ